MLRARTLSLYTALEVLQYTVLAFLAAAPVILLPNAFDRLGDFAVVGITARDVFVLLGWLFVLVAGYALPIAFVFGLLLALGRLHGDHELTAMRSCGLGMAALVVPVVGVGGLLSLATAWVSIGLEHRAWTEIESTKRQVLARGAVIEPGRFSRFGKRLILARERLGPDHFGHIMISDYTEEGRSILIFAESARYAFEPEKGLLLLKLGSGDLRMEPYPNDEFDEHRISFSTFHYSFRAPWLGKGRWRLSPNQLTFAQLRRAAASEPNGKSLEHLKYSQPRYYESHMHRMVSVPLTPLLFSMIGVPLAMLGFVRSRARGMLLALLLLGAYYGLFVFAYDAARSGLLSPAFAVWSPNVGLFVTALLLLFRAARTP